jgi:alkyldihydroxyacetonephosphate synthase
MPYQREILVPHAILADTFESAVTWDRFAHFHGQVMRATRDAIREATGAAGLVSCRFTHVYPDGPAPYYSFHARGRAGALIEQWRHIKNRASDAVAAAGGTITHHHAVGRDHMPWYLRQRPGPFGEALAAAKQALDPAGILNPGVLIPPQPAVP